MGQPNMQGAGGSVPQMGMGGMGGGQDEALAAALAASRQTAQQEASYRATGQMPPGYGPSDAEDANLQAAIAQSMAQKSTHDRNYEPIARVDQRVREKDQPTGLRNIGNTCYFNSLLQVYYTMPDFVQKILAFEVEDLGEPQAAQDAAAGASGSKENVPLKQKLVKSGMKLVKELQLLFATMALGKKKYLDPSGVLESVIDDQGDQVAIGDEKDISEYNQVLLQRIQDAFDWKANKGSESTAANALADVRMESSQQEALNASAAANGLPVLESQSSFADMGDGAQAMQTEPARFDREDMAMEAEEEKKEGPPRSSIAAMFECQVRNLVEFVDKKQVPQRKTQRDCMKDIVLYI